MKSYKIYAIDARREKTGKEPVFEELTENFAKLIKRPMATYLRSIIHKTRQISKMSHVETSE